MNYLNMRASSVVASATSWDVRCDSMPVLSSFNLWRSPPLRLSMHLHWNEQSRMRSVVLTDSVYFAEV